MKLFKYLMLVALIATVSCSKSSNEEDATVENSEMASSEADFIVDAEDGELSFEDDVSSGGDLFAETPTTPAGSSDEIILDESVASSDIVVSDQEGTYTVKSGETLMMVAFNVYGDYRMWKKIAMMNGISGTMVSAGATLKYNKPAQEFVWNPEGLPYLIKTGDTLGTISQDKYGTDSKWRMIYNNNKPLIKDPNLIFAGFTLYYVPDRDVASE